MQQQEEDGSFPLDPLLPLEELEYFQKRLAVLVSEVRGIRAQKQQTMTAISGKLNRAAQLARNIQNRTAVPGVIHLLPTAEHDTQDAPVPASDAPAPMSRPEALEAPDQHPSPAQSKGARPGRGGGGAQAKATNQSRTGARPGARGRGASTPPRHNAGALRVRRPPL